MRPNLPQHLIYSILILSSVSGSDANIPSGTLQSTVTPIYQSSSIAASASSSTSIPDAGSDSSESSVITPTTSSILGISTRPVTLWDIGFSLNDKWADLRYEEECPVPPDLVVVSPAQEGDLGPKIGDQDVLHETVRHLQETGESDQAVPVNTTYQSISLPTEVEVEVGVTEKPKLEGDSPAEESGKNEFVSFEDWKKMKYVEEDPMDEKASDKGKLSERQNPTEQDQPTSDENVGDKLNGKQAKPEKRENISVRGVPIVIPQDDLNLPSSSSMDGSVSPKPPAQTAPPHNRYNYASPDCSARIHSSSSQTQHASSLLHKSKDRYMLTPCKASEHWVVVELCDEIRVEAVEIAVWEFFSGVVREVKVSVGGAEDEDNDDDEGEGDDFSSGPGERDTPRNRTGWKEVGAFIGKNVRGVQTFTLPQPTSFHRFLRLDFPSYYGSEYYCPVSQLKVYGMNQMEAFKWEQKRQAASFKGREKERDRESEERRLREGRERMERELVERDRQESERVDRERELGELEKLVIQQASRGTQGVVEMMTEAGVPLSHVGSGSSPLTASKDSVVSTESSLSIVISTTSTSSLVSQTSVSIIPNSTATLPSDSMSLKTLISQSSPSASGSSISITSVSSATPPTSTFSRAAPPKSDSSESIYAFIIRRLTALEGNSTLVARYVEEQSRVMRGMLVRVEKGWDEWKGEWESGDRGRWETERMRQEDRLGRVISQMEQQRFAMEHERRLVQSQLRILSDELGYERRRGLAQLVILLAIITLGVATRGNTINAVLRPLLAEARRRRKNRKSLSASGPLAGIEIDMGKDRPVSIVGRGRPYSPNSAHSIDVHSHVIQRSEPELDQMFEKPWSRSANLNLTVGDTIDTEKEKENMSTPTPRHRSSRSSNGTSRRLSTPNSASAGQNHSNSLRRRLPSLHVPLRYAYSPNSLALSPESTASSTLHPKGTIALHNNLPQQRPGSPLKSTTTSMYPMAISPKPRNSLPPIPIRISSGMGIPPRKLGRNAHLHSIDVGSRSKSSTGSLPANLLENGGASGKVDENTYLFSNLSPVNGNTLQSSRSRSPIHLSNFSKTSNGLSPRTIPRSATRDGPKEDTGAVFPDQNIFNLNIDDGDWAETEAEFETEPETGAETEYERANASTSEAEDDILTYHGGTEGVQSRLSADFGFRKDEGTQVQTRDDIDDFGIHSPSQTDLAKELRDIWDHPK